MEGDAKNASGIAVRYATKDDEAPIYALACELADVIRDSHPPQGSVRSRLHELLDEPRAETLVAEAGGEVVGVLSFWIKPDLAHGDTVIEVPMLSVASDHRRSGVGKALMVELRNFATEHGVALIELVTTPANVVAREFYRSLGFVVTDHLVLERSGDSRNSQDQESSKE